MFKMQKAKAGFSKMFKSQKGVTAIEYGLIAALIALAIIVALSSTGKSLSSLFNTVATCV